MDEKFITSVRFREPKNLPPTVEMLCDVVIMDAIAISGVRIVNGTNGRFLGFPQRRAGDRWVSIVFPVNRQARDTITKVVLTKYQQYKEEKRRKVAENDTVADESDDIPF
jgi:stage V sporulation protein G